MVKGITKTSKTILDPKRFFGSIKKIIEESKSDRPGPCLIDIPMDIQSYEAFIPQNYNDSNDKKMKNKNIESMWRWISYLKKSEDHYFFLAWVLKLDLHKKSKIIESANIPSLPWPVLIYFRQSWLICWKTRSCCKKKFKYYFKVIFNLYWARSDRIVTAFNPQNFTKNAKIFCRHWY